MLGVCVCAKWGSEGGVGGQEGVMWGEGRVGVGVRVGVREGRKVTGLGLCDVRKGGGAQDLEEAGWLCA